MTNNIEFKNAYDQSGYAALMERFGPVVGEALSDNGIYEIMLNSDGSLFVDGNFAHMEQVGVLSRDEAESVIRTLATLMDKDLNLKCPTGERTSILDPSPQSHCFTPAALSREPCALLGGGQHLKSRHQR